MPLDTAEAESDGSRRAVHRVYPAALLFVVGFSAAFVALGLLTASFGRLIAAYRPVLETVAGIIMLAMGAFLLNLLPQPALRALLSERRLHLGQDAVRRLRGAGPFALGLVFAAGWTPCIGPVLAAILAYAGAAADRGTGAALLAIYSLGFAVPFLAVGLGWSTGLYTVGWARRHGRAITVLTGVALMAAGVFYLSGQAQVFAVWAQRFALPTPG
jgi:cytochrome c-type biogenesis protein